MKIDLCVNYLDRHRYLNSMETFAIDDIQGCHASLLELLAKIHALIPSPRLIFVGDLVNRGADSLFTLRNLRDIGDAADFVLGNHDLHLLTVANGIRKPHRSVTPDFGPIV